jgi:hypothetical protein
MTIGTMATNAAAQHSLDYLNNLLKPHIANTGPAAPPNAPSVPSGPVHPTPLGPQVGSATKSLLDGCVIEAIGRLPKVEGSPAAERPITGSARSYANSSAELIAGR